MAATARAGVRSRELKVSYMDHKQLNFLSHYWASIISRKLESGDRARN